MEPEQPYRPPSAHLSARPVAGRDAAAITANMVQFLADTRPWVVLLGVLGMIGCGLVVMVAVVLLGLGNAMGVDGLDSLGGAALGLVYISSLRFSTSSRRSISFATGARSSAFVAAAT